jgi:hypothetical protein
MIESRTIRDCRIISGLESHEIFLNSVFKSAIIFVRCINLPLSTSAEGLEPPTGGFGDRCSTTELHTQGAIIHRAIIQSVIQQSQRLYQHQLYDRLHE